MARSRNIKPGFFKNEYLAQLNPHARLLFAGLWLLADRRGRLEDRPLRIKGEVFPFEDLNIHSLLNELSNSPEHFITRYMINDQPFIQIENFHKHQNPHHREAESVIPPYVPEKPQASPGPSPIQVVPGLGNSGTSRADSLLLIPDSLTLKPDAFASACASVNSSAKENDENPGTLKQDESKTENQKLAEEGMLYLHSLNSPNHQNIGWVKGYLSIQLEELAASRPNLSKQEILSIWRDACDLAVAKNAYAPQWFKTTFQNKLNAYTPSPAKMNAPEATSGQAEALMQFPFIHHQVTGEIFETEMLEIRPDSPNGLSSKTSPTYYPASHLQGLKERPADA